MFETRELPILFSTDMVRAILDGRKGQTRRVMKPQPVADEPRTGLLFWKDIIHDYTSIVKHARYQPGDRLWVRETFFFDEKGSFSDDPEWPPENELIFRADDWVEDDEIKWKSPLFMPKKYARIWLEVTGVRVERVGDIKISDIFHEGVDVDKAHPMIFYEFRKLWNTIYKSKPEYQWEKNPWVWVYEFKRIQEAE
jgi:hypothetical protein